MSSDPKKPFDAPPPQTPDLLQKELGLDRRRRVPTFEELQAVRPSDVTTDPMRPAAQRPAIDNVPTQQHQAQPAEQWQTASRVPPENELPTLSLRTVAQGQPRPVGLVMPTGIDPRTQPMRPAVAPAAQAPRTAAPPAAQAAATRPPMPAPAALPRAVPAPTAPPQPPRAAMPPPTAPPQAPPRAAMTAPTAPPQAPRAAMPAPTAPPQARAMAAAVPSAAPQAPRAASPAPVAVAPARVPTPVAAPMAAPAPARVAPPSPTEFAHAKPAPAMPQIMASVPSQGAVKPEGQVLAPPRAQPALQTPVHQVEADEPEPRTVPGMPVQRPNFTPPPAPAVKTPNELPREMLVTQPGLPGPFAARQMPQNQAIPQRPPTVPEMPKVAGPVSIPELPKFDEPLVRTSDTVTAEPAALWRRTGAWLTDLLFVSVLVLGLLFVAMQVIAPKHGAPLQQLMAIALPGAGLAAMMAFVYTTLFAFLWQGRTPGRRLMGIHLVDTTGHAPGPVRALARAMLSLVSFALFLSGFWLALFDRHGQTLHDKLTRTFVVKLQDA